MWERPASNGGGCTCSLCHPDPRILIAEWGAAGRPFYNDWLAKGRPSGMVGSLAPWRAV
jgi:hypothetical protein